jgi:drug/metabolite transporter (DMT)-like permease
MNKRILALSAIILAGVIGGTAPFLQKIILKELNPIAIAFTRFFFSILILLPIVLYKKVTLPKTNIKEKLQFLLPSLFFASNIILYIIGLQFTTSTVSQVVYLLTSAIVLILSYLFFKTKITTNKILSVICGLTGGILLVVRSLDVRLIQSLGTIKGNILLLFSVLSWSLYLVTSKKQSQKFSPFTLLFFNTLTTVIITSILLVLTKINPFLLYPALSLQVIIYLIMLILFQSILFFFLVQWAMQHTSSFIASLTTYISPFITAFLGVMFLGEKITLPLIVSAILIFFSSYMILSQKK